MALIACELWAANLALLLVEVCWFSSTHPMFSSCGLAFLMKSLLEHERGAVLCWSTTVPSGACGSRADQQKTLSFMNGTAKGNSAIETRKSEMNRKETIRVCMLPSPHGQPFLHLPLLLFSRTHTLSHSFPLTKHLPSILTEQNLISRVQSLRAHARQKNKNMGNHNQTQQAPSASRLTSSPASHLVQEDLARAGPCFPRRQGDTLRVRWEIAEQGERMGGRGDRPL